MAEIPDTADNINPNATEERRILRYLVTLIGPASVAGDELNRRIKARRQTLGVYTIGPQRCQKLGHSGRAFEHGFLPLERMAYTFCVLRNG